MEVVERHIPSDMGVPGIPNTGTGDPAGHPPGRDRNVLARAASKLGGRTRPRADSKFSLRGKGASVSCISLGSAGSGYAPSAYSSDRSGGYTTAPNSNPTTPAATPAPKDKSVRQSTPGQTPDTFSFPSNIRPESKDEAEAETDYFSRAIASAETRTPVSIFDLPTEILMRILSYLTPVQRVRVSRVCKSWYDMCFDGQLWTTLDTTDYYRQIPSAALTKIIVSAGPFVKDLNLRGCVQLREKWRRSLTEACTNLEYFSLEGCRIGETPIHFFLASNSNLVHVNLTGLAGTTNSTLQLLGMHCPKLEELNISWCHNVDTRGLKSVVEGCPRLRDLRAGEVRGFDCLKFMDMLFQRNTLERLILMNCHTLTDESLMVLMHGNNPKLDVLTDRPIVPPRRLKHLDLTHCRGITDAGVMSMVHRLPDLEGLQLAKCHHLTDWSVSALLPTCPVLTHLDLEDNELLTNNTLTALASAPCAEHLRHLTVSSCTLITDRGVCSVLKSCRKLSSLHLDNVTDLTDVVLAEAVSLVRSRNLAASQTGRTGLPYIGLRLEAYDCPAITWTGVREVLSSNAEVRGAPPLEKEIISLKCFYSWQPTVEEHTKRVLRGNHAAAVRLERKWGDWMVMNEELAVPGTGRLRRRRRRRARDAQAQHAQEQDQGNNLAAAAAAGSVSPIGRPRPTRRRSDCVVM